MGHILDMGLSSVVAFNEAGNVYNIGIGMIQPCF